MKRTLTSLMTAAVVAFAAVSASAAVSVTLGSPDPDASYAPGDTITLTVLVTANGGAASNNAVGNISFPNTQVASNAASNLQFALPGFSGPALDCTTTRCRAFNQITPPGPAVAPEVTDFKISEMHFVVNQGLADGSVINFTWQTSPTTQQLNFFGLTTAAGYSVSVAAIPEPTTAALIGMGLFGLAVAGRRRS